MNEKFKKIGPRDTEKPQPEIKLKELFLEQFASNKRLSFFSSAQYPIVAMVMETDELYIDWHYVLEELLAESESNSDRENSSFTERRDVSKRLSFLIEEPSFDEIANLTKKINSFIKKWEEACHLKIPALNELDADTKNKENEPGSSMSSYTFG
jgi:hypothetical protein